MSFIFTSNVGQLKVKNAVEGRVLLQAILTGQDRISGRMNGSEKQKLIDRLKAYIKKQES